MLTVETSRNQPVTLCLHNLAVTLTAHIHILATRHHKGDSTKSARKLVKHSPSKFICSPF